MGISQSPHTFDDLQEQTITSLLLAATAAPSLHNSQPWSFSVTSSFIDVLIDPKRALPATDPDGWEQRLACGAALFNLRMAIMDAGFRPKIAVLPDVAEANTIARVFLDRVQHCPPWAHELARAIPRRHTVREPFAEAVVPADIRAPLEIAAREEGANLLLTDDMIAIAEIARLVEIAHQRQDFDTEVAAELALWTARDSAAVDGVSVSAGGPRPKPKELLRLRDFTQKKGRTLSYESRPLIAVLGVPTSRPFDDVAAGQAMQRVLLTATARGLSASFLAQVVEVPDTANTIAEKFLDGFYGVPRMVLRLDMEYLGL